MLFTISKAPGQVSVKKHGLLNLSSANQSLLTFDALSTHAQIKAKGWVPRQAVDNHAPPSFGQQDLTGGTEELSSQPHALEALQDIQGVNLPGSGIIYIPAGAICAEAHHGMLLHRHHR